MHFVLFNDITKSAPVWLIFSMANVLMESIDIEVGVTSLVFVRSFFLVGIVSAINGILKATD